MEIYLVKSAVILAIFFAFYKFVLESISFHNFKRFYLLASIVASFLIPLVTFTTYIELSPVSKGIPGLILNHNPVEIKESFNYWPWIFWTIYGIGALFLASIFFRNLVSIFQQIRKNLKFADGGFIKILVDEIVVPHTFLNYIFLNKKQFETGKIPIEVMVHEEAHARQKHSLDIILIEVLKIVFWFNPLFYFLKRSIKLNHEFLADEAVLKRGIETSAYQKLLLAYASSGEEPNILTPKLAHSINYLLMKKRFLIMKTKTSRRTILFRSLLILPLLSFLIYGFGSTETIEAGNGNPYVLTNGTIEDIQIEIDEKPKISLNGRPVTLSDLKNELNKMNSSLTIEEKQKYLSASIEVENEKNLNVAKKVQNILYSCNVRSMSVGILKNQRDAGLKYIPQINPLAGKTVAEAEVLYQQHLKDIEKLTKANTNAQKNENNPWSIEVQKNESNPWSVEVQKNENNPWSIEVESNAEE